MVEKPGPPPGGSHRGLARNVLVIAALLALILLPRLVGLDRFVTVDEPAWLLFAANFYHALTQGNLDRTVYDYHPAVTTLWALTGGFLSYFPGYRLVAKKYFDKYWQFEQLLDKYKKQPLTLLVRGRWFAVLTITAGLVVSFFLLESLAGSLAAWAVILLVAFDPYFLGHSRLLNHEAMMAVFLLVAVLAMLVFLGQGQRKRYLLLSGSAAGLALLTKSPALLIMPVVGLMFLVDWLESWKRERRGGQAFLRTAGNFILWLCVLALTYFVIWPGMWVNPGKMLYEVFGNAFSYAFQGARLSVTQELTPQGFALEAGGISLYLQALWLKTTPITWLGVLLALVGLFARKGVTMPRTSKQMLLYFGLLGTLFVLMFGLARGRNHMHYILTSYLALEVIAGLGLAWGMQRLAARFPLFQPRFAQAVVLGGLILLHFAGAIPQFPYYYTYTNTISQSLQRGVQNPGAGYGEGLELAGAYLARKPGAGDMQAMSWFAPGPFSYFFPGVSYHLLINSGVDATTLEELKASDYLVIYPILQLPMNMPENLLRLLAPLPPEHEIWLNGQRYIQIYKVSDLPEELFKAIQN